MTINKQLAIIVLFLIFITFIIYFILYHTTNHHEFYSYIDPIIHFNMGWVLYHCFRSLFPNQSKWFSFLYAMIFELFYELIELSHGTFTGIIYTELAYAYSFENFLQDVFTNFCGGLFGLIIESFLFVSNCPTTKNERYK